MVEEGSVLLEPARSASGDQRLLTREVGQVRFRKLDERIRLLPRRDFQRLAFVSVDSTAGMWCYCIPVFSRLPLDEEERITRILRESARSGCKLGVETGSGLRVRPRSRPGVRTQR